MDVAVELHEVVGVGVEIRAHVVEAAELDRSEAFEQALRGGFASATKIGIAVAAVAAVALLKTFDAKFWGVVVMGASVLILFFLPWLDRSPVRSIRYRPGWHKYLYGVFVFFFLVLGYLGSQAPSTTGNYVSQLGTLIYFGFFLLMPLWSRLGEFKPVPDCITFAAH